MKLWSYSTDRIEVSVHKWSVKDNGATFYTVSQAFKHGHDYALVFHQQQTEFQTFWEATEFAQDLVSKGRLMN